MSILIKGMEMPKEYGPHEIKIVLFVREDGTASLWGKEEYIPHEPLEVVPVPPHGDLFDISKVKITPSDDEDIAYEIDFGNTIIPAEGEQS